MRIQDKDTEKTQRSSREPVKAEKSHLGIFFPPLPRPCYQMQEEIQRVDDDGVRPQIQGEPLQLSPLGG